MVSARRGVFSVVFYETIKVFQSFVWSLSPFEGNWVSDPTLTIIIVVYTPPCCQGALLAVTIHYNGWAMDGPNMLRKVLGQVDERGLNCARKVQQGLMDTSVLRKPQPLTKGQQLSAPKGTIRFDSHRWANSHIDMRGPHREGPNHQCRISSLSQVDHDRLRRSQNQPSNWDFNYMPISILGQALCVVLVGGLGGRE